MNLIPLFDPKKNENAERNQLRAESNKCNHKIKLFPEGSKHSQQNGNWLPQDACGGFQWNARIGKWQKTEINQ